MLATRLKTSKNGRQSRRGTTLQEMLVVLAIVVSLVGSGWPAISGGLGKSQLRSGAKQLRSELAKARLTAMENGVAYQFRYQLGTGHFEVAPVSALNDEGEQTVTEDEDAEAALPIFELELPEGVVFGGQTENQEEGYSSLAFEETQEVEAVDSLSDSQSEEWSAPIVFFPNGRTANAQFTLQNEDGHLIMVTLRGLTGSATVGDLKKVEVPE
ncbi:hypothetical protein CA54_43510 [Symmachiella macrocystis]|uniref:General secretion pathway GspH domain-containing protein n=1 Tax=Symmachiella macrocystis TaxID=2527985 RepID=A0A5C6BC84_9PLAN|nr:hypothetical protein [Symmachiella macrocystis]TWU09111.1 hypothetical protein CA54_43510 [Symmachiella macrocystis]